MWSAGMMHGRSWRLCACERERERERERNVMRKVIITSDQCAVLQ